MSIEVTRGVWDNSDKNRYRIEFLDGWQWEDFSAFHLQAYHKLAKIDCDIDLIVLFLGKIPKGSSLSHLNAAGEQPTNIRHTVMVNATDLTTKLFVKSMISSVVDLNNWVGPHFVDSLAEAREYLATLNAKSKK